MKRVGNFFIVNTQRFWRHIPSIAPLYAGSVVSAISGLIVVIVLANTLTPTEYGNYKYIFSIVGVLSIVSLTGGYRNTIIQSTAKQFDGAVTQLTRRNLALSAPVLLAALCLSVYYAMRGNTLIATTIPIVALSTIIGNYGIIASAYLNGRKKYNLLLVIQCVISVGSIVGVTVGVLLFHGLLPLIISLSFISILISILSLYYVRTRFVRNTDTNSELTTYGKHLNILNVFSTLLQHIDSVLVFTIIGANALALYALATPFVDRIIGLFKSTYFFMLPKFTEAGPSHARVALYQKSLFVFLIGIGITFAYILVSPYIFSILFPQYMDSIKLSWLFAFNIPIIAFTIVPQAYLDSLIEIRNKYIVNGTAFLVRIGTLVALIHPFGVLGVILSELITRGVGALVVVILIERFLKKKAPCMHGAVRNSEEN